MSNPMNQPVPIKALSDQIGPLWMFRLGVLALVLGQLITFAPGGIPEVAWYAMTALMLICGLRARQNSYRLASVVLITVCVALCLVAELRDPPAYRFLVHEHDTANK